MNVFTIPAGTPFADTLVSGIMARYGHDSLALSHLTLLLPTRRSCRAVQEAFLRHNNGKPMLLPTISPLGDMDEEGIMLHVPAAMVPPVINPLKQWLYLARMIAASQSKVEDIAQAAYLAIELSSFLAEMQTEGCSFDALAQLVPEDLAAHWQHTLSFLQLLSLHWPQILAEEGVVDPATYRNLIIAMQADIWQKQPPIHPIIAAGSTGSIPMVARLLQVIAALPHGMVVLPALDTAMDEESWQNVQAPHPQSGLKRLLSLLNIPRQNIQEWHPSPPVNALRARLIREIMRPVETIAHWQALHDLPAEALTGITMAQHPTLQQEATTIALMMREALEQPGKTVALITPERRLARRVASLLKRWDIHIDDSAGYPLKNTPAGTFLQLMAELVEADAAPLPLLSLLKHPLAAGGMEPTLCRRYVRQLEVKLLRGVRVASGFSGIKQALSVMGETSLITWTEHIESCLSGLISLINNKTAPLDALLNAHIRAAELLSASHDQEGASRLWAGDSGSQAALFSDKLLEAVQGFGEIDTACYAGLYNALWSGQAYRPRYGRHPRLVILSPEEARLHHFDMVILGGLTEGSWPQGLVADPWMNRSMREKTGLPSPEQRIGHAAHEFATYLHTERVVLSWSEKIDGTPTVPSRWLLKLLAVLKSAGLAHHLNDEKPWSDWAEILYTPSVVAPTLPPAPTPPLHSRPRQLSVTHVERWLRDPYGFYAARILRLKMLEPLDADPGMAEFGNFLHKALDQFTECYLHCPEGEYYNILLEYGYNALAEMVERPAIRHLWIPRFERIAAWMVEYEQKHRNGRNLEVIPEAEGQVTLGNVDNPFIVRAKADRLEIDTAGIVTVIDYKTGIVPTQTDVTQGLSPQLTLEALIAEAGGFPALGVSSCTVGSLQYIRLTGAEEPGEIIAVKDDVALLTKNAKEGLELLIAAFDRPETAYLCCPWPEKAPVYNDYAHLARIKEWSGVK